MTGPWRTRPLLRAVAIEYIFAALIVAGAAYCVGHMLVVGYMPPPLFYDISDNWMDWFNTAYYGITGGAYVEWNSIYPPLSFVFLRLTNISSCFVGMEPPDARRCDWLGVVTLHGFYLLNLFIVSLCYLKIDRRTALPRAIAMTLGLQTLNGFDRGNLVIVCFTCFALAYGPLLKRATSKAVAAGLAVNFKVYLIAAILPHLLRRRWHWVETALLATVVIYLLSYAWYGGGAPVAIVRNIASFADSGISTNFLDLWNAGTYRPTYSLMTNTDSPIALLLGSSAVETIIFSVTVTLILTQSLIIAAAVSAALRPEAVPPYRLTNLGVCLALITSESGAYTNVFVLFLVFMEPWRGPARITALVSAYLLSLPWDVIFYRLSPIMRYSFFTDHEVLIYYPVTYGPMFRPGLLLIIAGAIACATLADVWRDVRQQQWRGRWRFRRDIPLLMLGGRSTATTR